jgi:DNA polymerase-3 subunit beta
MRVTIPQSELADAAKWVEKGLPSNPLYPVMMTMRFQATGDRLLISGWDGDTALHAELDADIEEEGVALLPGKFLAGVVTSLRKSDLTIECSKGQGTLTAPGVRIDIRPSDAGQWPNLPAAPAVAGTVDGPEFIRAYTRIKPASVKPSEDEVNELSGVGSVRLVASEGELRLATTDRFRVGLESVAWAPVSELGDAFALVPTQAIERVRPFAKGRLTLALPENGTGTAGLSGGGREIVTKLSIPKTFPNVDRAVPQKIVASAHLEAAELVDAIRTVSMVNTKPTRPVWLRFDGESVAVSANDMDSAEVRIDARLDIEAGHFEVPFRGYFLTDGLAQVKGVARIDFSGPKHPALIQSAEGGTFRYVVLPIGDPAKASAAA